ncbi:DNA-binding response regulator [Leptolyngbya sp. 'hensonii']|uniref:response regulator transcription factor n=1 Tax=Leptolyngbya sp. 'hensonii' TaxID=1922337 RepID=UPI00094FB494|nr:response regulator transcription factor [Leptolyngbya sp. 'hensonii']OLP17493.1 DNA-binding response regulator [Leptolyngbya sp. 'hensonii']
MSTGTLEQLPRVLVIEPDESLAQNVYLDLKESGYDAVLAHDANSGISQVREVQPALIVIDRMLTGDSGLRLCNQLRSMGTRVPMLLLMSRDTVEDRVACLEAGADDYFLKPYRTDEFLNLIRLYLQPDPEGTQQLRFGDLVLDLSTRQAFRSERAIELTMKEFELLKYSVFYAGEAQ